MPGSLGQTISFGAGICMGTSINNKKRKYILSMEMVPYLCIWVL